MRQEAVSQSSTPAEVAGTLAAIRASRMHANGGYFVMRGLLGEDTLRGLSDEAVALRPEARHAAVACSDATEDRGGSPARSFASVPGGTAHRRLHLSQGLAEALGTLSGVTVVQMGGGTYSYYTPPGDFLAVHRDVAGCDLAMITCLSSPAGRRPAGGLVVYPAFRERPLSLARAAGPGAGVAIALERGDTILLFGGITPHEVTPVECERIVAIMCYRVLAPGP
jgi:hypothetical protein